MHMLLRKSHRFGDHTFVNMVQLSFVKTSENWKGKNVDYEVQRKPTTPKKYSKEETDM